MSNLGNREVFAKNLRYYIERSGKTQREVAEIIGVAASTFNDWAKGKKYPRMDKVEKLANLFGILKSDLIEDKSADHKEMQKNNDIISDIIVKLRMDADYLSIVESLYKVDSEKMKGVRNLLDAFIK